MNQHIETMKGALYTYKKQREAAEERVSYITETYGKEAGAKEKELQDKKTAQARAAAESAIRSAGAEGLRAAEAWGRMDGSKLTDDIKLLDAGLVDEAEFDRLKQKHSGNATMLAALRRYGDKQNAAAREELAKSGDAMKAALTEPFNTRDIPTAEGKQEAWKKTQAQALDMLDAMDGTGKYQDDWTRTFGRAALPEQLEHFGEGRDY